MYQALVTSDTLLEYRGVVPFLPAYLYFQHRKAETNYTLCTSGSILICNLLRIFSRAPTGWYQMGQRDEEMFVGGVASTPTGHSPVLEKQGLLGRCVCTRVYIFSFVFSWTCLEERFVEYF